jgi:2-dehydropantoate 2-reductase
MRAKVVDDAVALGSFGGAALQSMIGALELAGWSFARWPETLPLGAASAQQALAIAGAQLGRPAPAALRWAMRPLAIRAALPALRALFPADLETYLRVHFTKVGDQTVSSLGRLVDEGRSRGLPTDRMEALLEAVAAARGARVAA